MPSAFSLDFHAAFIPPRLVARQSTESVRQLKPKMPAEGAALRAMLTG